MVTMSTSNTIRQDIKAFLESMGGKKLGRRNHWRIPSPTGGYFLVEVTLRPRWCMLAVDRWHTTDRHLEASEAWFKEHVWPHVQDACKARRGRYGILPSGGGTFAVAGPLDRAVLLDVLTAWVQQELTWGMSRAEMGKHWTDD